MQVETCYIAYTSFMHSYIIDFTRLSKLEEERKAVLHLPIITVHANLNDNNTMTE